MSAGLATIAIALLCPAAPPSSELVSAPAAPSGLQQGNFYSFEGTVAEEVKRPGKEFRRAYELRIRVFVLERTEKWADVAVMTLLRRTDDSVAGTAAVVTGAGQRTQPPPLLHLELIRVHADGVVHLLAPTGPAPLKLDADTPARMAPVIPLDSFAPSELGMFPPHPPKSTDGKPWAIAPGGDQPIETWQARDIRFLSAERCQCLVMNHQSSDWLQPVGGVAAWHRAEAVWVSTQDGTARTVHRVIRQRDGKVDAPPAAWVEVKYELATQFRLAGRLFDGARLDFEMAYAALAVARRPLGTKAFDMRLAKLDAYIKESDPAGVYREALAAARRALEAARSGEVAPLTGAMPAGGNAIPAPSQTRWPQPGQIAPDLRAGSFHLLEQKSKPVVLLFFKPGGETTDLALAVADALQKRYGGKVVVVPLVVFGTVADAAKDRDRRKLAIPLYEGAAAASTYAVESVPRFAVIDAAGKVRWTFTGIGNETGYLVREQVDRLAPPIPPNVPAGTTAWPGPIPVPLVPPP